MDALDSVDDKRNPVSWVRELDKYILPPFPLPPSVNKLYMEQVIMRPGQKPYAQRILTAEGRKYKQNASQILIDSGCTTSLREFVERNVTVEVHMYVHKDNWYTLKGLPNRKAGDADNRVKVLQDAIFNTIGVDDCTVFYNGVRKVPKGPDKVIVVICKPLDIIDEY